MKLSSLLSEKTITHTQQEQALLALLRTSCEEIKKHLDFDFKNGEMDYLDGLKMTYDNSTLFDRQGRCFAEVTEILDHVKNEKVIVLIAGYDADWEEAYIIPTNSEMIIKKAGDAGKFVISFRGHKFTFTREEAENVFGAFVDNKLFDYQRIGDRIDRRWLDDEYDYPRHIKRKPQFDDERDLDENDYAFEKEGMYGALIYKDLYHY